MKVWHDSFRFPGSSGSDAIAPRPRTSAQHGAVVPAVVVPALLIVIAALLILFDPKPEALAAQIALVFAAVVLTRPAWRVPRPDTVVLVGTSPIASVAASLLADRQERGRTVVLQAASFAEAAAIVRSSRCAEVIMADPAARGAGPLVDARGIEPSIKSGAEAVERLLGRVPLRFEGDARSGRTDAASRRSRLYETLKRAVDIAFALGLGLAVVVVVPLVALIIRLDSPGPVIYSQQRVGLDGRIFRILKFRTMRQDAERNGAVWAQVGDDRVTRAGRFLRLTRIDELPQLWNVLRGDMTLVGPRPERPEFTSLLGAEIPGYAERHRVKPGITGWAQVRYRYSSSVRDAEAKLEYDLYYVKYRSLGLDLRVLLRTVLVVVQMRGC